jgi:hypothetical protein
MRLNAFVRQRDEIVENLRRRAQACGWPCVVASGRVVNDNRSAWELVLSTAPVGVLDALDVALVEAEQKAAQRRSFDEREAERDRQRQLDEEHRRKFEADRLRRLMNRS